MIKRAPKQAKSNALNDLKNHLQTYITLPITGKIFQKIPKIKTNNKAKTKGGKAKKLKAKKVMILSIKLSL